MLKGLRAGAELCPLGCGRGAGGGGRSAQRAVPARLPTVGKNHDSVNAASSEFLELHKAEGFR